MKFPSMAVAVITIVTPAIIAISQTVHDSVDVPGTGAKSPNILIDRRPRHCVKCSRYVQNCVDDHPHRDPTQCVKEVCHDLPGMCDGCPGYGCSRWLTVASSA
ncbi:hypothetical protein K505DRAFT_359182 [Melanomma pulvis-pyrius CBS 109.77]|uniref:Uncharacterized protein n=1 Tax=Melanomma pulvis-pyrius CBS 109.77 TaxID=1314802 RepID=A0A6A6XKJ7_9PLEO|nr:hypothetical protein K505DRAFT_359182 [Melanomma pulvis-pyrius CBS 109.77]